MDDTGHTRARARKVADRVRLGTPISHACALEDVPRSTLYAWRDADPEIDGMLAKAKAEAAMRDEAELRALIAAGSKSANVMLHLMERLYPDEYAPPPKRVESSGVNGGAIKTESTVRIDLDSAIRIARSDKK